MNAAVNMNLLYEKHYFDECTTYCIALQLPLHTIEYVCYLCAIQEVNSAVVVEFMVLFKVKCLIVANTK